MSRGSVQAEAGPALRRTTSRAGLALRLAGLCAFGLYLVVWQPGLDGTFAALASIDGLAWVVALAWNVVPPLAIGWRSKDLLRATGHAVGYLALARDAIRAAALNTVTLMGAGDVYRVGRMRAYGVPVATGGGVAILDRALGVASLVALIVVVQASGHGQDFSVSLGRLLGVGLAGVGALGSLAFLVRRTPAALRLRSGIARRLPRLDRDRIGVGLVARVLVASLVANVSWILCVAALGRGLGLELPLAAYFDAAPLVALATLVPITIGGLGLREAGYVLLLGSYGVPPAACVALGLAQHATFLGLAAIGGLLFVWPDADPDPVSDPAAAATSTPRDA